jgi:hypothetical protein
MDKSKVETAKALAEAHLGSIFDKYLVIGFNVETGEDVICNCTTEQLKLLLLIFQQRVQNSDEPTTN